MFDLLDLPSFVRLLSSKKKDGYFYDFYLDIWMEGDDLFRVRIKQALKG